MLHLDWEDVSMVLQSEGHLTMGTKRSSEQQVSWQALLAMPREKQLAWAQDRKEKGKTNEDVLLVVEQRDLPAVRSLHGLLSRMDPGGLGVLVLLDSDAQLFPTVADWWGSGPGACAGSLGLRERCATKTAQSAGRSLRRPPECHG